MDLTKKLFLSTVFVGFSLVMHAQSTDKFDLDKVYSISPNGTISVNSDDADVSIIGSDRPDVHVEVHYKLDVKGFTFGKHNKFAMNVRQSGDDLELEEKERDFSGVTFGSVSEKYTIRMDQGRGSLRIDVDDGQADIRNANFSSIDLSSDDGDFSIETALSANGSYHFDMDDGDLELSISGRRWHFYD